MSTTVLPDDFDLTTAATRIEDADRQLAAAHQCLLHALRTVNNPLSDQTISEAARHADRLADARGALLDLRDGIVDTINRRGEGLKPGDCERIGRERIATLRRRLPRSRR